MPQMGQKRLLALDANILIDLAEEKRFAQEFRGFFQEQGFTLFVPPTVNSLAPIGGLCPEGTFENSPAFQRWVLRLSHSKSRRDGRKPA